jgi:hypothetical protein
MQLLFETERIKRAKIVQSKLKNSQEGYEG